MTGHNSRCVAVVASIFALTLIAAVDAAAQERGSFKAETTVNVIEVPVRVFDSVTGEPITGLSMDDFRVREAGRLQQISHFSEISRVQREIHEGVVPDPSQSLELIYFFDLYLMDARDKERALAGIRERYSPGITQGERITLISYDGELRTHVERASDRWRLELAVDELEEVAAQGFHHVLSFSDAPPPEDATRGANVRVSEKKSRSMEFLHELERHVEQVGTAMSATLTRFAGVGGRRVLVAFTPGHPGTDGSPGSAPSQSPTSGGRQAITALWRELALEAANLGFTVFAIDPGDRLATDYRAIAPGFNLMERGHKRSESDSYRYGNVDTNIDLRNLFAETSNDPLVKWLDRSRERLMVTATELTGGVAIFDADAGRALAAVEYMLDHYYSLAYVADHAGDGKVYRIEVSLPERPEYRLEHRRAYVDQPPDELEAQRMRSRMQFGSDQNPLFVRVAIRDVSRTGVGRRSRYRIALDVQIPYGRIDMVERGNQYWGRLLITFFKQGETEEESKLWSEEQPVTIAANRYHKAVAEGYYSFKPTLEVLAGEEDLYLGVQDLVSGNTSLMPLHFDY
jgi:VWFA-related protein